jgi:hypothetical protein
MRLNLRNVGLNLFLVFASLLFSFLIVELILRSVPFEYHDFHEAAGFDASKPESREQRFSTNR